MITQLAFTNVKSFVGPAELVEKQVHVVDGVGLWFLVSVKDRGLKDLQNNKDINFFLCLVHVTG